MNTAYLIPLLLLGIAGSAQYFLGTKKNRWLGHHMSQQAERLLKPKDIEYINIGGAIGYHFKYKLRDPWSSAKGSYTFIPRHSLLYVPFTYLVGNRDRFFMNLFTDKKLIGEGHIIEKKHLNHVKIDGQWSMSTEEIVREGKTFVLFWRQDSILATLKRTLDSFPELDSLTHFCCFDDNKTFFLYLKPKKGEIENNLKHFLSVCPEYFKQ
jgi:hypothetical protein